MDRNPEIENFLGEVGKAAGFECDRDEARERKRCLRCGSKADAFTDAISESDYKITLLCQHCQDEIYNGALDQMDEKS